jgi:hypothetical protein
MEFRLDAPGEARSSVRQPCCAPRPALPRGPVRRAARGPGSAADRLARRQQDFGRGQIFVAVPEERLAHPIDQIADRREVDRDFVGEAAGGRPGRAHDFPLGIRRMTMSAIAHWLRGLTIGADHRLVKATIEC